MSVGSCVVKLFSIHVPSTDTANTVLLLWQYWLWIFLSPQYYRP